MPDPGALFASLDLDRRKGVLVAVSGGGDSLALLFLLKTFLGSHAPHVRLVAVTVDHRLRPRSAAEALAVARMCGREGIEHRTLEWTGEKSPTGLIAAARDARHSLIAKAALEAGTDLVLTGHTLDDQAETVAMRSARGEGEGQAGIAPATLYRGRTWFCRPLLGQRRAMLREWLKTRGIGWIDDPSNEDPRFERARLRARLEEQEIVQLAGQACHAGRKRQVQAAAAARLIDRVASLAAPGLVRLDPGLFGAMAPAVPPPPSARDGERSIVTDMACNRDAVVLALRIILASVGGTSHLPDRQRAEVLVGRLGAGPLRATLSRSVVDARPGGIWVRRETRNLPSALLSVDPQTWDGRWTLSASASSPELCVSPIGKHAMPAEGASDPRVPQSIVRAAFSAEPGLFERGGFVAHVGGGGVAARGVQATALIAPHATYLPSFDLELAAAMRRLFNLAALPAAPWKDHIDTGA